MTTFIGPTPNIPLIATPRPTKASVGEIRFNTTANQMEAFDGTSWTEIVHSDARKLKITIGEEKFGDCNYWVQAEVSGLFSQRREKNNEIDEWVHKTYGPRSDWGSGRWSASDSRYWFKEKKDRDWFVLRWTE